MRLEEYDDMPAQIVGGQVATIAKQAHGRISRLISATRLWQLGGVMSFWPHR